MDLTAVIGAAATQKIQTAGEIVFHTVGDTGGVHSPQFQFAVADAMAADSGSGAAFWYHLGDVVYYFGQDQYYFEQFYDPYRNYNAPIFAITQESHDLNVHKSDFSQVQEYANAVIVHLSPYVVNVTRLNTATEPQPRSVSVMLLFNP